MVGVSLIPWSELAPAQVEAVIAGLLVRTVDSAVSVDGAGGDDGADVVVYTEAGQRVWEVKSFRARLAGPQKKQIRASLATAVARRRPVLAWTLVLPLDLSPAEQRWFDTELAAVAPGVALSWMGLTALEVAFAQNPALLRLLPRSSESRAIDLVRQMGQEKAALTGGIADAIERGMALRELSDALDPDYAADFTFEGDRTMVALRPKDPGATQRRPITGSMSLQAPVGTPESEALAAHHAYGTPLTLPGEHVTAFAIDLPPAMSGLITDEATITGLQLVPSPVADVRGQLAALGERGTIAKLRVVMTERSRGARGVRLLLTDDGASLQVEVRLDEDLKGGFSLSFTAAGKQVADVLPAVRFLAALAQADRMMLTLTGYPTLRPRITGSGIDFARAAETLAQLELLERVQDAVGESFPIPVSFTAEDVNTLAGLDVLLSGGPAPATWDGWKVFDLDTDFVRSMLPSSGPFPRGTMRLTFEGKFNVAGHILDTGRDVIVEAKDLVLVRLPELAALLEQQVDALPERIPVWMAPDDRTLVTCWLSP
jgi:hypothetical protein